MSKDLRKIFSLSFLIICLLLCQTNVLLYSQDWAKPVIKYLHRLDLRHLGYPQVNEIPANSSAITSLLTSFGGLIYGGTSGESAYLFVFDPSTNKVRHLGKFNQQKGIHHSLVEDKNGLIYIGTGKNIFKQVKISGKKGENIAESLWHDIKNAYRNYPGGHLYCYNPKSNQKVKLVNAECDAEDLGIPVPGNGIYALTINPAGTAIYGLTYPDGHFFIFSIKDKKFNDLGEIDPKVVFHGPERDWRSLPRALICDDSGRVYTSGSNGKLVYYDPKLTKIVSTGLKIPGIKFPIQFGTDYPVVEYFARDSQGKIYGGTSDGYLFSFCPVTLKLVNLGKPRMQRRLRALTVGGDGKVYLLAGERKAATACQLYSYDPKNGGFSNLGVLIVDRSPFYYRRGHQFDCMTTGLDDTIYMGESEYRSHLFLYVP